MPSAHPCELELAQERAASDLGEDRGGAGRHGRDGQFVISRDHWAQPADVTWWRELHLATRAVIGRDGRFLLDAPLGVGSPYFGAGQYLRLSLEGLPCGPSVGTVEPTS